MARPAQSVIWCAPAATALHLRAWMACTANLRSMTACPAFASWKANNPMRVALPILLACVLLPAIALAEVSVRDNVPFRQDSGLTKAEYFISTQKYAQAIAEAEAVVKRHGPNADAYAYAGLAYQKLGDDKKAVDNYRRALMVSQTHLGANTAMMHHYIASGNMPKAIEQLQVIRAVCGTAGCEELYEAESAINAAKQGSKPAQKEKAAQPVRGETPREVE